MNAPEFLSRVARTLNVPEVAMDTRFRELPGWCSMLGFGLLVMMENEFGSAPDAETFTGLDTVADLYAHVTSCPR